MRVFVGFLPGGSLKVTQRRALGMGAKPACAAMVRIAGAKPE